jgi:hypothetical protein
VLVKVKLMDIKLNIKIESLGQALVAHAYNPSYLGG